MSTFPKLKRRRGGEGGVGTSPDTDFRIDFTVNEFTIQLGPVYMEGGCPSYRPIRAET